MLLKNFDKSSGLCNEAILIVSRLDEHVIEAIPLAGRFAGRKILIARMLITHYDYIFLSNFNVVNFL